MENVVRQQIHAGIYSHKCKDCSGAEKLPPTDVLVGGSRVLSQTLLPGTPPLRPRRPIVQTRHERASSVMPSVSPYHCTFTQTIYIEAMSWPT